jgi:hypothetical protein
VEQVYFSKKKATKVEYVYFYKDIIEEDSSIFFRVKNSIDGSVEQLYISNFLAYKKTVVFFLDKGIDYFSDVAIEEDNSYFLV